jgi:hypothetical protein
VHWIAEHQVRAGVVLRAIGVIHTPFSKDIIKPRRRFGVSSIK